MKKILFLIILFVFVGCSSTEKVVYDREIDSYMLYWIKRSPYRHIAKEKDFYMPVFFSEYVGGKTVGICSYVPDLKKRYVMINKTIWDAYPKRHKRFIMHLLNYCYSIPQEENVDNYGEFSYGDHANIDDDEYFKK